MGPTPSSSSASNTSAPPVRPSPADSTSPRGFTPGATTTASGTCQSRPNPSQSSSCTRPPRRADDLDDGVCDATHCSLREALATSESGAGAASIRFDLPTGSGPISPGSGLPSLTGALYGACLGAGVLALLNRLGALVLRRLADTKERLWPVGMDQLGVAALLGAFGWPFGLAGAATSLAANVITRRTLRLPEPLLYGLWLVFVAALTVLLPSPLTALSGSLVAAGGAALVGALYWWVHDLRHPEPEPEDDDEPVAMGFGDVKLAGVLGAMLGAQNLLVALLLAFLFGAVGGLVGKALGRGRVVPFGPYLVAGAWVALFYGTPLVTWYLGTLGL